MNLDELQKAKDSGIVTEAQLEALMREYPKAIAYRNVLKDIQRMHRPFTPVFEKIDKVLRGDL